MFEVGESYSGFAYPFVIEGKYGPREVFDFLLGNGHTILRIPYRCVVLCDSQGRELDRDVVESDGVI